jgi:type IV pilus assembly protein PilA
MVVVVIIGLLATLALPAFERMRRRSQNTTIANDLRVFAQAFDTYASQNGNWPGNAGAGAVPPGMSGNDFKVNVWQTTTPIGGRWNWDYYPSLNFGFKAGISISGFTCSDAQLQEIDALIDDGDLSTGNFQKVAANRASYILDGGP